MIMICNFLDFIINFFKIPFQKGKSFLHQNLFLIDCFNLVLFLKLSNDSFISLTFLKKIQDEKIKE